MEKPMSPACVLAVLASATCLLAACCSGESRWEKTIPLPRATAKPPARNARMQWKIDEKRTASRIDEPLIENLTTQRSQV